MDKRRTFLDILKENINILKERGIITEQELKKGIQIPIEWIYTSGIDRNDITGAIETICHKVNSTYENSKKYSEKIETFSIAEKGEQLFFTLMGRDNWTECNITDGNETLGSIRNITSEQFIKEIYAQKLRKNMTSLVERLQLSEQEARDVVVQIFNETQKVNDLKGLSESLCEMSENFGKYYEYMHELKNRFKKDEADKEIEKIYAGVVQINKDEKIDATPSEESKPHIPKQNQDYEYDLRNEILMAQKPIKLISFDTIEDGVINPGAYVSYVYRNPREEKGYFLVIEPTLGNREGRITYLQNDEVISFETKEKEDEFWKDIATKNLELSKKEFLEKGHSSTYYHTTIEAFKQKFEYILLDKKSRKSSVIATAKRTMSRLYGTQVTEGQLATIARGVSLRAMENARKMVLGKEIDIQEEEK